MKQKVLLFALRAWLCFQFIHASAQSANQALSNLTSPTAINQELLPNGNNIRSLGSSAKSWRVLYLDSGIYLKDVLFLQSRGIQNTFVGQQAGNSFTTGRNNAALGYQSLSSITTGVYNTATGADALYLNTTGHNNTAAGYASLYNNTTGFSNAAFGTDVLYSNTTGSYNTAYGDKALFNNTTANNNTALGYGSLYKNTTGNYNTATGFDALYANTTASYNMANGYQALFSNTTGSSNVAIGVWALYRNTTGSGNTASGIQALYNNITGFGNTANGSGALDNNSSGIQNTATGYYALLSNSADYNTADGGYALLSNTSGTNNTATGYSALYYSTTGSNNTTNGAYAMYYNTGGSGNTAIGANTNVSDGFLGNATALGYSAIVNTSNKVRIGNADVILVESQAGSWTTSDGRFKNNIKENVKGLEFIKLLKPVTYNFDTKKFEEFLMQNYPDSIKQKRLAEMDKDATAKASAIIQSGFIAQDVAEAIKKSGYNFNGVHAPENPTDNWSLSYEKLVVPLVKAVQELDKKTEEIDELKTQLHQLTNEINELKQLISNKNNSFNKNTSYLSQNIPNPSNGSTIIPFQIATGSHLAIIQITQTGSGKVITSIPVNVNAAQATLNTSSFAAGSYMYSLIVDGKIADTRQMNLR